MPTIGLTALGELPEADKLMNWFFSVFEVEDDSGGGGEGTGEVLMLVTGCWDSGRVCCRFKVPVVVTVAPAVVAIVVLDGIETLFTSSLSVIARGAFPILASPSALSAVGADVTLP